jgi:diguanylate cyclase (GGDEF)-like protein
MIPTQPSQLHDASPPTPAAGRLSARGAALLLVGLAAVMAAALATGLGWLLGPAAWAAPLGAALGVVAAALPLALLGSRLPRDLFLELAGREWARSRRYGTGAALLVVEVDRFARLVESRGTAATDAVLTELLRQTGPTLRGADVLTRFAESQMAVFLAPADAMGALDVAERIRERAEQLEVPFYAQALPQRLRLTVSVGVAHLRPAHLNLQALVEDALDAAAAAREAGGNCVRAAPVDSPSPRRPGSWVNDQRARPQ